MVKILAKYSNNKYAELSIGVVNNSIAWGLEIWLRG